MVELAAKGGYDVVVTATVVPRRSNRLNQLGAPAPSSTGAFFLPVDPQWRFVRGSLRAGRLPNWPVLLPPYSRHHLRSKSSGGLPNQLGVLSC